MSRTSTVSSWAALALFLWIATPVRAQSGAGASCNSAPIPVCLAYPATLPRQIKPQAVPTTNTAVALADAYVHTLTFNNTSGGALVITILDRQATPVAVPGSGTSIAAGQSYVISFPGLGYWCPGGFSVSTTSTGMVMYAEWNQ